MVVDTASWQPSRRTLISNWNQWLVQLRQRVTPDPDGASSGQAYGTSFKKSDLAPIPAGDLPFGVAKWLGKGDTAERVKGKDCITCKPTGSEE